METRMKTAAAMLSLFLLVQLRWLRAVYTGN